MEAFTLARTPRVAFGSGALAELPRMLGARSVERVLLIVSRSALADVDTRTGLLRALDAAGVRVTVGRYDLLPGEGDPFEAPRGPVREASPDIVDAHARAFAEAAGASVTRDRHACPAVVAIGGGSAIDTGKAIAAVIGEAYASGEARPGRRIDEAGSLPSIVELLEGVGSRTPSGRTLPFFAVPTTAGTGSEATMNAVLARVGGHGFKKSLRHENFVPEVAIIDPALHLSCPRAVTAASGLDAITQLLEAYVARTATPVTDALALDGLAAAGRSFLAAVERGESDLDARAAMAYAAYLSGVCLATAGLGTVHGLAGAAGAYSDVPHGVFCGKLLPLVVERTAGAVSRRRDALGILGKYAAAGRALSGRSTGSLEDQVQLLVSRLHEFARVSALPGLSTFGFDGDLVRRVAGEGNNKANPYEFSEAERVGLLESCL